MTTTLANYRTISKLCQKLFIQKVQDYGSAWRILRLPTFTDQIMIKAYRVRRLQDPSYQQAVNEGCKEELVGIINYCIMALMQVALEDDPRLDLPTEELLGRYDTCLAQNRLLLKQKNSDYNEAWRLMRIPSIIDIMLMKVLRIKHIEDNGGKTVVSEGVSAGYQDILNYAFFALVLLQEADLESTSQPGYRKL